MNKIFSSILLIFTLAFSSFSIGAESQEESPCTSESLVPFSVEICKEDVSFRIFYQLFPELWENVIFNIYDFKNINELKNDPSLVSNNQYLKFSYSFKKIFEHFNTLIYLIVFVNIVYLSVVTIIKNMENGNFLESDWKFKDVFKGYASSFFMLIPVGGLFIIQIVLMFILLFSIALGNFVFGYILFETSEGYVKNDDGKNNNINHFEHNYFFSNNYVNDLTKINLCRQVSSQYNIQKIGSIIDQQEFAKNKACYIAEDKAKVDSFNITMPDFKSDNPFLKYSTKKFMVSDTGSNLIASKLDFGALGSENCEISVPVDSNYLCGELNITVPNIENNIIINDIVKYEFYKQASSVMIQLNSSDFSEKIIYDGWINIENKIKSEIEKIKKENDNSLIKKINPQYVTSYRMLEESDYSMIQEVSYVYHQLILNYALSGKVEVTANKKYLFGFLDDFNFNTNSNISNFKNILDESDDLALLIQEYNCLENSKDLNNSYSFLNKINGKSNNDASNARCIDFKNNRIMGLKPDGTTYDKSEIQSKKDEVIKEIKSKHKKLVNSIYQKRTNVEKSYLKSLFYLSNNKKLSSIRKKGWLAYASFILNINKEYEKNNINKIALLNSVYFQNENYNEKYISNDIYDLKLDYSKNYSEYNKYNVFAELGKEYNVPSEFIDKKLWQKEILSNNVNEFNNGNFSIREYFNLIINPIKPLKEAMGIRNDEILLSFDENLNQLCSKDASQCPMPTQNPFIQLSNLGHYYINASIGYFTAITVPVLIIKKNKNDISKSGKYIEDPFDPLGGEISDKQKEKNTNFNANKKQKALDFISQFLSFLNYAMVLMLIAGVIFAYVLPLMPFLYYMIGFLSYFILFFAMLFVILIFAILLIRYHESKKEIYGFMKNYLLVILFKPSFMVISFAFIFVFYTAVIFFINLTIGEILSYLETDGLIMSIFSSMISLFILSFILYIITNKIFDMFEEIYDHFFNILDISNSTQDSDAAQALKESSSTDGLIKAILGYSIFNSLTKKAQNYNFGKSYKLLKKEAEFYSSNRLDLLTELREKNPKMNITDIKKLYDDEIEKNPQLYGKIKE